MASGWSKIDVIFIRHGESSNNSTYEIVSNKFGDTLSPEEFELELYKLHNPDCGLSVRGEMQAMKLREYLEKGGLSYIVENISEWKIISSPMHRCLLTAEAVCTGLNVTGTVLPFLFESDGCYQGFPDGSTIGLPGMTATEVESRFKMLTCAPGMEKGWYKLNKKETKEQFNARTELVSNWLWEQVTLSPEEKGFSKGLIVVAHGNLMQSVITRLLKSTGPAMLTHDNTGHAHLQLWSNESTSVQLPALMFSNRVDHLIGSPHLICGGRLFEDHWIQEYLEEQKHV